MSYYRDSSSYQFQQDLGSKVLELSYVFNLSIIYCKTQHGTAGMYTNMFLSDAQPEGNVPGAPPTKHDRDVLAEGIRRCEGDHPPEKGGK